MMIFFVLLLTYILVVIQQINALSNTPALKYVTKQQIVANSAKNGIDLSLNTFGPGFRAVARASHDPSLVLGYCEGFIRPGGKILHMDKMEVYDKIIKVCHKQNPKSKFKAGSSLFGVGLNLGYLCVRHGFENNCQTAEILAIDDSDKTHQRLIRYYKRLGLEPIRYVGDDVKDIPDRLVWGGCGTLMRAKVDSLMSKWNSIYDDDEQDHENK